MAESVGFSDTRNSPHGINAEMRETYAPLFSHHIAKKEAEPNAQVNRAGVLGILE